MDDLFNKYMNLESNAELEVINKTAQDLTRRNYMPPYILEVKDFYYFTK